MRELRVLDATRAPGPPPFFVLTTAAVGFGPGFQGEELEDGLPFRWMELSGNLHFEPEPGDRFLELWVRSHFRDLSQRLRVRVGVESRDHELPHGWNPISVPVPQGADAAALQASRIFPREYYPEDSRELAVQVRGARLHQDPERHRHVRRQYENAVRNTREMLEGRTVLESTPVKLGIDVQGACNVKPPCVYCAWDFSKEREGEDVDAPFDLGTLDEYGPFFDGAAELVNCSIGEPFMGKDIDSLLDAFGNRGKMLELTTNGQILTDVNIAKLLGRDIHLYVSLDAATAETYARLRNNTFPRVLENLRRLIRAKGGRGRLPLVYLVFMPMRANVHEADAFVRLCAELMADRLVLRPLNPSPGLDLRWDRAGYHYDYQKELLPWEELVRVSGRMAELCEHMGVALSDQLDFGGSMEAQFAEAFAAGRREARSVLGLAEVAPAPADAQPAATPAPAQRPSLGEERLPACTEPWTSLYVLRRGTLPCCYGGKAVARMAGFAQAWNSPLVQDIRRELARGQFHSYCFDSPDCPIVKKSEQGHRLSTQQRALLLARRALDHAKRRTYRLRGRAFGIVKRAWRPFATRANRKVAR